MIKKSLQVILLMVVVPMISNATKVTVGPGGFLHRDGEPVFVIGAYQPPKGKGLKDLAQMGFNVANVGTDEARWKELEETGLWAWVGLGLTLTDAMCRPRRRFSPRYRGGRYAPTSVRLRPSIASAGSQAAQTCRHA